MRACARSPLAVREEKETGQAHTFLGTPSSPAPALANGCATGAKVAPSLDVRPSRLSPKVSFLRQPAGTTADHDRRWNKATLFLGKM